MYKALILNKFELITDFFFDYSELKKKYSFLQNKNIFKNKILISIITKNNIKNNNYYNYKNFFIKKLDNKFIVNFNGKHLKIENSIFDYKIKICIDENFSKLELISLLDNLIIIKLIQSKFLPIHSSGFSLNKTGYLLASYGGTGKTRLILEANKFAPNCKIFDEWCLIKKNKLFPLRKEILLMDYDILSYKKFFHIIDFWRAKFSKFLSFKKIKNFFHIFKLALPYKYKYFKNVDSFSIDKIFFINQKKSSKVYVINVSKKLISKQILKNFKHEKKQLVQLVSVNNSITNFKNKINLMKLYNNMIISILDICTCKNVSVNKENKDFNEIFNKILIND
jgi:hypothetical protein